ncbi:MAG: FG-GAP and VCBS repeat-containing protein [Cyclobacteriaceae bacterium]
MKSFLKVSIICFFLIPNPITGLGLIAQEFFTPWKMHTIDNSSLGSDGTKLADVNGNGKMDMVVGWEEGGITRLYFHPENPGQVWEYIEVPSPDVEDAFAVDLDGDGFKDLVTFSEGKHQRISVHWAPSNWDHYYLSEKWLTEDFPETVGRTRWMFGKAFDMDGKNGIDLIVGSKDPDGTIGWLESPPAPRNTADWKYHEISKAGWIMSIELWDMNLDRHEDILITDRKGDLRGLRWLEKPGKDKLRKPWNNHFIGLEKGEPMFLGLLKTDQNRLPEIIVPDLTRGWHHFYQPDGTWNQEFIPFPKGSGSRGKSVVVGDIDQDGQQDLAASFEGALQKSGVVAVLGFQEENPRTIDISGLPGVKYDFLLLIDMDGDGDLDILTSEETSEEGTKRGLGVIWYENPLK